MESNHFRGTKNDFSYLVDMALQSRMPWNILALNFNTLAPTLNETREIISILLKELEKLQSTLQKKEKLLEKFQTSMDNFEETKIQESYTFEKITECYSETVTDDIEERMDDMNEEVPNNQANDFEVTFCWRKI